MVNNNRIPTDLVAFVIFIALTLSPVALFSQEECFDCHDDAELTTIDENDNEVLLYVNPDVFAKSIHGEFGCVGCHVDAEEIPHEENLENVDCSACHDDAFEVYQTSIHAKAKEEGALEAASCADCHGKHDIVSSSNPESRISPLNVAATCAICHADPKIVKKYHIPISNPLAAYNKSVHGIAVLSENNFDAATCISCHGSHDIRDLGDPDSPIYWKHVPETCGQCHGDILEQYTDSIHWTMAEKGVRNSPVCIDCHGEHTVSSPKNPDSPVHPLKVSAITCERCHGAELIIERYGIAESRASTFEESYHGLAIKGGSLAAANCASCHGIHNILRSSNPASLIHPRNLKNTCGSCHPDATENFAKGAVHLTTSTLPGRIVQYVKDVYILLIIVVIGGMLVHNCADFIRRAKRKVRQREENEHSNYF